VIFVDDVDRVMFLRLLARFEDRFRWTRLAYCLMGNHYHLLMRTPNAGLAAGMQRLNGCYAQWFNRRHARTGHLFQGRYGSELVRTDAHLLATARYIEMNPVAAGLCAAPEEWRWSQSAGALAELLDDYQR